MIASRRLFEIVSTKLIRLDLYTLTSCNNFFMIGQILRISVHCAFIGNKTESENRHITVASCNYVQYCRYHTALMPNPDSIRHSDGVSYAWTVFMQQRPSWMFSFKPISMAIFRAYSLYFLLYAPCVDGVPNISLFGPTLKVFQLTLACLHSLLLSLCHQFYKFGIKP